MTRDRIQHEQQILDQFSRQARVFQDSHRLAEGALKLAVDVAGIGASDRVLDVACGPGVLACALAAVADHVTGIDITPAMLKHARKLQSEKKLRNVAWHQGDVANLPYPDADFSVVISRYAFHHLVSPATVLGEMVRVCRPGGRIVVIDSAPEPDKAAVFNRVELLRDPSHTQALTPTALEELMAGAGLKMLRTHLYAWEVVAQSLIARSFPLAGDAEKLSKIYEDDVGINRIGMNARFLDNVLHVTFPTLIAVAERPI